MCPFWIPVIFDVCRVVGDVVRGLIKGIRERDERWGLSLEYGTMGEVLFGKLWRDTLKTGGGGGGERWVGGENIPPNSLNTWQMEGIMEEHTDRHAFPCTPQSKSDWSIPAYWRISLYLRNDLFSGYTESALACLDSDSPAHLEIWHTKLLMSAFGQPSVMARFRNPTHFFEDVAFGLGWYTCAFFEFRGVYHSSAMMDRL